MDEETEKKFAEKVYKKPSVWFFAEWLSIIGTFAVCFVFLFHQNQLQCARSDKLYEQFQDSIKAINDRTDSINSRTDKLYEMFYEVVKEKK